MSSIGVIVGPRAGEAIAYSRLLFSEIDHSTRSQCFAFAFGRHCDGECGSVLCSTGERPTISLEGEIANALARSNVVRVLIGSSRLSIHAESLAKILAIPVYDLGSPTAAALRKFGLFPAAVLGTCTDAENKYWEDVFRKENGEMVHLSSADQEWIGTVMGQDNSVCGVRARLVGIVAALRHAGARSIVLCTPEIRRYLREEDSLLPLVCAAEQQVKAVLAEPSSEI